MIPLPSQPAVPEQDPVLGAMVSQDMELVDSFDLASPPSRTTRGTPGPSTLAIEVAPTEDSVMLLEQDGVFAWRYPASSETIAAAGTRRGPLREPPRRRVVFDLSVEPLPTPAARRTRGPVADFAVGKVRAYVFRFVARAAVSSGIGFLERKKRTGLVRIVPEDPAGWQAVEGLDALQLPQDRPARILLLVHGTFSSTFGSFGALTVTEWGRTFLALAAGRYDAIVGYDHRTLSLDPLQNAEDLLARLERTGAPFLEIDAIAFSRGGLVLRSLVEYLLPSATLRARVRRAVFVGATNGGTQLAVKENWTRLIDLMTNLVAVGARALSLYAPAAVAAGIVRESIETLGALVKSLAAAAVGDDVPGLAAMVPGGEFVTRINQAQPGQPGAAESLYYVVSSEFDVQGILSGRGAAEFPARLAQWIADAVVDAAIKEGNDLVVNTASMSAIDTETGGFVKDEWHFARNFHVYHTIYFTRQEVTRALTRWLELEPAAAAVTAGPPIPAGADDRIVLVSASEPLGDALEALRHDEDAAFAVAERETSWGQRYRYAYRRDELIALDAARRPLPLEEAVRGTPLEMHEGSSTPEESVDAIDAAAIHDGPTGERVIVRDGDATRAVVERGAPPPPPPPAPRRRARGARAPAPPPPPTAEAKDGGRRGTLFVSGAMPESIPTGQVVALEVVVSQEAISVVAGPAAAVGKGTVNLDRSVLVQVIPKQNLSVEGADRFEVDPSTPRTELVFDVKGAAAGQGEIWVLLRQGPVAVVTLKLTPQIVAESAQPSTTLTRAAADATPADPRTAPYPLLQIFECRVADCLKYHFALTVRPGQYVSAYSNEIRRPREQYVTELYKEIEDRWLTTKGDYDAFLQELRAYGATLLDELVPARVQAALWAVRDTITAVQVVAEEPFIPWELVHLKEPPGADGRSKPLGDEECFLGQLGLTRWLHNVDGGPLSMSIRKGRSFYVIPKYPHPEYELPAAQQEIPFLRKTFGAKPVAAEVTDIRDILRGPGALDLFHFSGHGEADAAAAVDAQLMLGGTMEQGGWVPRYLKADLVAQHARLTGSGGERPLIVLNACQIGRAGWRLTSIGGFAESFIRNGAGAFVGSLWSVGDDPAHEFSEAFYGALTSGATLAQAAVAGRAAAREAKDATWLAYVVYGYPHAMVSVEK